MQPGRADALHPCKDRLGYYLTLPTANGDATALRTRYRMAHGGADLALQRERCSVNDRLFTHFDGMDSVAREHCQGLRASLIDGRLPILLMTERSECLHERPQFFLRANRVAKHERDAMTHAIGEE